MIPKARDTTAKVPRDYASVVRTNALPEVFNLLHMSSEPSMTPKAHCIHMIMVLYQSADRINCGIRFMA